MRREAGMPCARSMDARASTERMDIAVNTPVSFACSVDLPRSANTVRTIVPSADVSDCTTPGGMSIPLRKTDDVGIC